MSLKITKEYPFSKIGVDEIAGLKDAMTQVVKPLVAALREHVYWDSSLDFESSEYKSRDGFIPHSHNCGGLELNLVIPQCEQSSFDYLEFGEHDESCDYNKPDAQGHYDGNCSAGCEDGYLDAKLRIWLKFEGIENGVMSFYLVMSGGNNDAPYFREQYQPTLFEASFEAKTLAGLKRTAKKHINKLLKTIK